MAFDMAHLILHTKALNLAQKEQKEIKILMPYKISSYHFADSTRSKFHLCDPKSSDNDLLK